MRWIKIFSYNLVAVLVLFLLADFVYTLLQGNNIRWTSNSIEGHPVFHHTLKKQMNLALKLCTDKNGFKVHCGDINRSSLSFDVVFIGDSFTEGINLPYEDTFVGMYDLAHPSLKIANLGVASYSPTRYLQKISYYLNKGLKTKHVVVFSDISDMYNEAIIHRYESFSLPRLYLFIHKNFVYTGMIIEKIILGKLLSGKILPPCPPDNMNLKCSQPAPSKFRKPEQTNVGRDWVDNPNAAGFEPLGVSGAIERSLSKMEKLHSLLDQHGIKLSIGVYPWRRNLEDYDENTTQVKIWKKFCDQKCFAFINTYPDFFKIERTQGLEKLKNDYILAGDGIHFNKNGNRVIFRALNRDFKID